MKATLLFLFVFIGAISCHMRDRAHKMYIGSGMLAERLRDPQYKAIAEQEFNCLTPGNEMKWASIEWNRGQRNYGPADQLVQFAQQHGMKVRGHTLIWHAQIPSYLNQLDNNTLHQTMLNHIWDEVTHFKGKIYAWDVVNEVLNEDGSLYSTIWSRHFGESFIAEAFRRAHEADPNAKLYINDFRVETKSRKSDGLYNLVKRLRAQGVPIHGVGMQAHLGTGNVPRDLAENMRRFSDMGVDVAITELDLPINGAINQQSRHQQAMDYAYIIRACVSVPRCVGVTIWGFIDKYSWLGRGDPLPWDSNYRPKEAVSAITNALQ